MPSCPEHPDLRLERKKRGWFCDECGLIVAPLDEPSTDPSAGFEHLPPIFAIPLAALAREGHPQVALWRGCDAAELALRFAVMVALGEFRHRGEHPVRAASVLRANLEEPTLGRWRDMALALVQEWPDGAVLSELPGFVTDTLVPLIDGPQCEQRTLRSSLLYVRNQLAHGGGMTTQTARELLEIWRPRILDSFARAAWIAEVELLVASPDGAPTFLRGTTPKAVPAPAADGIAPLRPDEVRIGRRGASRSVWPLMLFGRPRSADGDEALHEPTPQVYVRRGESRLLLTPLGSIRLARTESDHAAFQAFLGYLWDARSVPTGFDVRGFEEEIQRDSARLVGRDAELASLRATLDATPEGILWLEGRAGVGKSYLMARIATDQTDRADERTLVLAYRFRAGDDRCERGVFLRWARERLEAWRRVESKGASIEALRALLRGLDGRRVLFILDGLDEIAEADRTFADEVLRRLANPGVCWLCAGRPTPLLRAAFRSARPALLSGLHGMSAADVRSMIMARVGSRAELLLRGDLEVDGRVVNPFVDAVVARAEGLPIYVRHVVGDVLANRFARLDGDAPLPRGLASYHEEILSRGQVGTLAAILTPTVALLALAREALTAAHLREMLEECHLLPRSPASEARARDACARLESIVCGVPTPEGGEGYGLYHHSVRQHLQESPTTRDSVAATRAWLTARCARPSTPGSAFTSYVARHGVLHLVDAGRFADALRVFDGLSRDGSDGHADSSWVLHLASTLSLGLARCGPEEAAAVDPDMLARVLSLAEGFDRAYPVLRLLRAHHLDAWDRLLPTLLREASWVTLYATSLVLAEDHAADASGRVAAEVRAMLESSEDGRAELGAYALKLVWTLDPTRVDRELLERLATSRAPVLRGVAGEAVLNLALRGVRPRPFIAAERFWRPPWPYGRVQVAEILAAERLLHPDDAAPLDEESARAHAELASVDARRRALLEQRWAGDDEVRALLEQYYALSAAPERLRGALSAIDRAPDLLGLAEVFLAHPAWEVRDVAASTLAKIAEARPEVLPWAAVRLSSVDPRMRYGVVNLAGFASHLDGGALFQRALDKGCRDAHCWVRGITAAWVASRVIAARGNTRDELLQRWAPMIRALLRDDDIWALTEMHSLLRTLVAGGHEVGALLSDGVSRFLSVDPAWYARTRDEFDRGLDAHRRGVHSRRGAAPTRGR